MTTPSHDDVLDLYRRFADGGVSRREFMKRATALGIAGAAASALGALAGNEAAAAGLAAQAAGGPAAQKLALDLSEWSYMWVNVKRADTAMGSFVGGQQMYVEVHGAVARSQAVSDRARARRRRAGPGLDGHTRWASGLVPVPRRRGLSGLRRR